jgi:hypothetical protein
MTIARKRVGLMALALVLGLGGTVRADLLYATAGPDEINLTGSLQMTNNNVAANFGFGTAATLTDIFFISFESPGSPGYTGAITWSIYQDNSGAIGATLFSATTSNVSRSGGGTTASGFAEWRNDIPVSIALGPGSYWLGLHNGPLSYDSSDFMLWAKSTIQPRGYEPQTYDLATGGPWVSQGGDLDLVLELFGQQGVAPVPEPSTLIAAGVGGLLLLGYACCRGGSA